MSSAAGGKCFLLIVLMLFISSQVFADTMQRFIFFGTGILYEKNNDNVSESARLPLGLGFGFQKNKWHLRGEYSAFRTIDGNASAAVAREHEAVLIWPGYQFADFDIWSPYVSVGVGIGRTNVGMSLNGITETARGSWAGIFAIATGWRGMWTSNFSVRPELRYESTESFKIKDARTGVFLHLEYLL